MRSTFFSVLRQPVFLVRRARLNLLLHHFKVDLLHINLFAVLRWKLGALEELGVDAAGHVEGG